MMYHRAKIGWRQKFPGPVVPYRPAIYGYRIRQIAGKRMSVGPNESMHYSLNIFEISTRYLSERSAIKI